MSENQLMSKHIKLLKNNRVNRTLYTGDILTFLKESTGNAILFYSDDPQKIWQLLQCARSIDAAFM